MTTVINTMLRITNSETYQHHALDSLLQKADRSSASHETPLNFMDLEGPSSPSEQPAICPHPERDQSSPRCPNQFI